MKKVPSIKELRKKCSGRYLVCIDILYRNISIYLTKTFLYTPITPNQISGISILIGILGGIILSFGDFWSFILGGILIILYTILDRVDGEVARYKNMTSSKGQYIEFLGYHSIYLFIYIGLVWGVYRGIGNMLVLSFGLIMILFKALIKHIVDGYQMMHLYEVIKKRLYKKDLIDDKRFFPKKLNNIVWEINALITDPNDYIGWWIIIGAIFHIIMPGVTIYSFMLFYILLQLFLEPLKLIISLKMYLFSKKI